jgi:hypothetical protein
MRSIIVPLELTVSLMDGREWPVKALAWEPLQMLADGMFAARRRYGLVTV